MRSVYAIKCLFVESIYFLLSNIHVLVSCLVFLLGKGINSYLIEFI